MKKFILFFFAMVLSTVTGFAKDVVFDVTVNPGATYTDGSGTKVAGPQSITLDGITIAESADAQWDQQYRIYKNHDFTVTSTVGAIAKIEFTCTAEGDAKYGPGCFSAMEGYSYDGAIGTWVGEAEEVVFHAESNQVRATQIVVTLAEPADPVVFSEVVDGGVYAIVNVQPTDPIRYYWLDIVEDSLEPVAGPDLTGHYAYPKTAQYKAILLEDGRWAFENVATGNYLAWRNHNGQGGNGNKGYSTEINEFSSWTMNDGTLFSDLRTYWFYVNNRSETNVNAGTLILSNNGYWNAWGATECNNASYSNDFGFVACAGEVDFEKSNIAAINQADFVEAGKWYLLKQKRGGVSPVYDAGEGATMKRAANDNAVVAGMDAAAALDYLVSFVPTENEGAYNIKFANGRYWANTMTTTSEEPGEYNVYNINGEATHIGINLFDMENIVDNNGAGNTLAFWASGEVTELDGNNDWTVWEVEFAPKTTAASDLKALISEVEAAYALNNVAELGDNLITETSQFSSPYTEPSEGDINALIDGDCSTFWHSAWSQGTADMHVHYLQVELPEAVTGDVQVTLGRRKNQGSFCANDNVVLLGVEASADGENFVEVGQLPMPLVNGEWYERGVVTVEGAKVFRFFNDESNGTLQRGYWHAGEFQLNLVTTPALNVTFAEAAAALQEAIAAAKEAGAGATDADVAALQAAYDAYVAALTATPADQYVLNFDKDLQQMSDDRHVTGFKLNDQQVDFPAYQTVYLDATNQCIEVKAGEELKPAIIWDGAWMHGLVYVDLGNDGSFYEEGDLVAHSPYTGNQNLATTISAFNAPEKEGVYRLRIKTDWVGDSQTMDGGGLDPAGRIGEDGTMEGNNSIWKNRGRIIDIMLKVVKADEPKPFPAPGVAYKIKNVDAKLYLNVIDNVAAGTNNGTILGAQPMKLYFEAVEGGYYIKNEAGLYVGGHTNTWSMSSAVPEVWTIEEAENGTYKLHSATGGNAGYLGFDSTAAGSSAFRDKGADKHWLHTILEFDAVEPLTFEFVDNTDGSITVIPSDDKAEYFFDIFSDEINARQGYANDREGFDFDIAYCVTAPELEVHTGTTTVDPTEWVNYWFGGAMAVNPGEYRLLVAGINPGYTSINSDVFSHTFQVVGRDVLAETWENIHALLAEADAILALNQVTITYDRDGYFKDFTSPIVGKVGYKNHDVVWAICDGVDYVKAFTDYFESAAEAEEYMADFGGIASLEDILKNVVGDYKASEVCLPVKGQTYIIYSDPYTYSKSRYAYVLGECVDQPGKGYYGPSTMSYGDGTEITNEFVWACEGPVAFERENEFFEKETVDIRYQFTNVESGNYLTWKNQDMWYLSGQNAPYYGALKMQVNADNNLYRWLVIDMRDGSLNQANGDCTGNTYSNWYYFEEFEPIVTNWDPEDAPVVNVLDDTTASVVFPNAHSVEATNYGVLAAIFDEQGDAYALAFNDLFPETVEFEGDHAVLNFKKVTEINAELAEAAKGLASKVSAAVEGGVGGKIVIASKSFKVDGAHIYNNVIIADHEVANGQTTGIENIALDANTKIFDLQGRRVAVPAKGLLIRDGKKSIK